MRKLGIKVALVVALIVTSVMGLVLGMVVINVNALVSELTIQQAGVGNNSLSIEMENFKDEAIQTAERLALSNDIINAIIDNDMAKLKSLAKSQAPNVEMVTICDTNGIVLIRAHGDKSGDDLSSIKAIGETLKTGIGLKSIEMGSTVGLSTRGSSIVKDFNGNVIGVISCGHDLSNPVYVDRIKEKTNCEITLFSDDTRINTTIQNNGERVLGTKASDEVIDKVLKKGEVYISRITLFDKQYEGYYTPIIEDGKTIGMYFSGLNIEETESKFNSMINTLLITGVISVVIAIILIILLCLMWITRPLKQMCNLAKELSDGNVGIKNKNSLKLTVKSKDEVGQLAALLSETRDALHGYINEISLRLGDLQNGDLTHDSVYNFKGDFITIKDAFNDINKTIKGVMGEINAASGMVAQGASQIATNAQFFAASSLEQTNKVSEINININNMNKVIWDNAKMAREVAENMSSVRESAKTGTEHMQSMVKAVDDISQASNAIVEVIKVIDDIAAQTNILAINASIEAARAGQHGKGFAIVADEVRKLAIRSSAAAKDTGDLIDNTILKAKYGAEIAQSTNKSFDEITQGVVSSTAAINKIADESEKQAKDVETLKNSVESVSISVQQNSTASEQSAALSEELTGQSTVLKDMVSNFKIN